MLEIQSELCISTILHGVRGQEIGLLFALINGYNFGIVKAMDFL